MLSTVDARPGQVLAWTTDPGSAPIGSRQEVMVGDSRVAFTVRGRADIDDTTMLWGPQEDRQPRETMLRVSIQHGEDDLREWPMANQPPGALATIDRRAVSCVWGGAAWCWVHVSGGPPVMLGAPYDELVAWWRGGR